jgi:hypothetical protein
MKPHHRKIMAAIEGYGATDLELTQGRKHFRLWFTWNGKRQFYILAGTLSDELRGVDSALAGLRKIMGLTNGKAKSARRGEHRDVKKREVLKAPKLTIRCDPKDALLLAIDPETAWQLWWQGHLDRARRGLGMAA